LEASTYTAFAQHDCLATAHTIDHRAQEVLPQYQFPFSIIIPQSPHLILMANFNTPLLLIMIKPYRSSTIHFLLRFATPATPVDSLGTLQQDTAYMPQAPIVIGEEPAKVKRRQAVNETQNKYTLIKRIKLARQNFQKAAMLLDDFNQLICRVSRNHVIPLQRLLRLCPQQLLTTVG
jgi:hypothetical protein